VKLAEKLPADRKLARGPITACPAQGSAFYGREEHLLVVENAFSARDTFEENGKISEKAKQIGLEYDERRGWIPARAQRGETTQR
jgi:hypothetical protein